MVEKNAAQLDSNHSAEQLAVAELCFLTMATWL